MNVPINVPMNVPFSNSNTGSVGKEKSACFGQQASNAGVTSTIRPDFLKGKQKWGLTTPRASMPSGTLLKDLTRSISDFIGPLFDPTTNDDNSVRRTKRVAGSTTTHSLDELLDFLNPWNSTKQQDERQLKSSSFVAPSSNRTSLPDECPTGTALPDRLLDLTNCNPFVMAEEFRKQFFSNIKHSSSSPKILKPTVSLSPSLRKDQRVDLDTEALCRNELANCELLLEKLRVDVGVHLAVSQALSLSTEASEEKVGINIIHSIDEELTLDNIFIIDDWNSNEILTSDQLDDKKSVKRENDDLGDDNNTVNSIDEFLRYGTNQSLDADFEQDPVKRCEMILRERQAREEENQEDANIFNRVDLRLGSLASGIASMTESVFPSAATNEVEYIVSLLKCPVLCFNGILSFNNSSVLPHLKQDAKDLTRDILRMNGQIIRGCFGYKNIYQELAKELVPSYLRDLYQERELKATEQVNGFSNAIGSDDQIAVNSYQSFADIKMDQINDIYSLAELQALILLHFVNRTLAGGHCFEKVMDVFGKNGDISLIVPNSSAAKPIEIILLHTSNGDLKAILHSPTNFRILSATSSDPLGIHAEVDAHFISDVYLSVLTNEQIVQKVCRQFLEEFQSENNHNISNQNNPDPLSANDNLKPPPVLSPRLISFVLRKASLHTDIPISNQILNAAASFPSLDYRIYLSVSSSPS